MRLRQIDNKHISKDLPYTHKHCEMHVVSLCCRAASPLAASPHYDVTQSLHHLSAPPPRAGAHAQMHGQPEYIMLSAQSVRWAET